MACPVRDACSRFLRPRGIDVGPATARAGRDGRISRSFGSLCPVLRTLSILSAVIQAPVCCSAPLYLLLSIASFRPLCISSFDHMPPNPMPILVVPSHHQELSTAVGFCLPVSARLTAPFAPAPHLLLIHNVLSCAGRAIPVRLDTTNRADSNDPQPPGHHARESTREQANVWPAQHAASTDHRCATTPRTRQDTAGVRGRAGA